MKFSLYKSVRSQNAEELTAERFNTVTSDPCLKQICNLIARAKDHEEQQRLKNGLPIVTWNAHFEGQRKNELATPSGAFMLDVDDVERPFELWNSIVGRREELGILLAHKTPSTKGLRLVCRCRKEFSSIDECQRWLAKEIGVVHDAACKDWARSSYLVPAEYVYYMDGRLFTEDAEVVYGGQEVGDTRCSRETREARCSRENGDAVGEIGGGESERCFKGVPLVDIAKEWLMATGGEPVEGERNTRIHALAYEMRCITDFNEGTLLEVLPRYGLNEEEMKGIVHSACSGPRSKSMPKMLEAVLEKMQRVEETEDDEEDLDFDERLTSAEVPVFPPLIRQIAQSAPEDFRAAAVMCTLPILGTLGSKLRARYLDGHLHSPSFQVSLEAPQASGKSFMSRMAEQLLAPVLERDKEARQKEQEYNDQMAEMKVTGMKVTKKNKEELLGQKPKGIVRFVPATISITKLLMRLNDARGLHLFAVAEEIDTVTKAFKRGFSSYGDLLRVAFDNRPYGQDYASDTSFSGIVNVYYNTLFSGTPKAMRRFYPDVEDGLVSRVCFVQIPDQFGKPMPVWRELTEKEKREVEMQVERLDKVSIEGDVVQPDHVMELEFVNRAMDQWLKAQQEEAVKTEDRTRDIFCRRAAVVGFRAGMIAWFLNGEKNTATAKRNTVNFAKWVATEMLRQHLLRFQIEGTGSNTFRWEEAYRLLGEEFSRDELQQALVAAGIGTPVKHVIYRWKLLGCIEVLENAPSPSGNRQTIRFKKTDMNR